MSSNSVDRDRIRQHVDVAREIWIKRLIDPSRANSLLFYRDLKVGTLDLGDSPALVDALVAGETIDLSDLADALPSAPATDNDDQMVFNAGRRPRRSSLQASVQALRRKALTNQEEKGIDTLFLAIGMASWDAGDGGRPYDAPVLLFPVRIDETGREGGKFRISVAGEAQINPVLIHVLAETFSVVLAPIEILGKSTREDGSGESRVSTESVLGHVESLLSAVVGLEVKRRAILGNFSFAKMAMVEDLRRSAEELADCEIVAAIAGHADSRARLAATNYEAEPTPLDDLPPNNEYLVLNADSTQQRAVGRVSRGDSVVVQGPPGTGKSQTIANLIAQGIADGKRILFVAEKRAALEAVIKRLSDPAVGLGHILLDLHGATVSRKDVMGRLAATLDHIRQSVPVPAAADVHREFESHRRQLNEHARRINEPRLPARLSVFDLIGRLLRLGDLARTDVRVRGATLEALSPDRAAELRAAITEAAALDTLVLGTSPSAWNNADVKDGEAAQRAVDLVLRLMTELVPRFESEIDRAAEEVKLPKPPTLADARQTALLITEMSDLLQSYTESLWQVEPAALVEALAPGRRSRIARLWAFATSKKYRTARTQLRSIRKVPAPTPTLLGEAQRTEKLFRQWFDAGGVRPNGPARANAAELVREWRELEPQLASLEKVAKPLLFLSEQRREDLKDLLRALAADRRTPYLLPRVHRLRIVLHEAGLAPLLEDYRTANVAPEQWARRFDYAWLHSTLDKALSSDPNLAAFKGRTHDQVVAEFIRLDAERVRLAADRVRRIHGERAISAMNQHFDQADLVRREANKRIKHISLRELLARTPDVLTRVAPCWLASPLSVSQLLPSGAQFDLVVFDEASQVLQEEAIPALGRARQVVVAGDQHQLPPTAFFATTIDVDDTAGERDADATVTQSAIEAIGGFDSLLETLQAFLPNWMLEWHYRSEDERLIAFSNEHIYQRRLVTFPSARGPGAISHVLVAHDPSLGTQDESASREVETVVGLVLKHAEERPDESLGVIAMGIKHANRVQAALDRALEVRPDLVDFFVLEKEDRFFVKNLETVQGDERDAIILTVGYGKSADGSLSHQFGPLTQDTGHRRLNVAVTRARRRMTVVSSFAHHEVDLARSGGKGVRLLKAYLEYAANGGTRMPESESAGEGPINAFEADVQEALSRKGIHLRPQFGASRYRIDLVAMHPSKAGRPVLAIECDGAAYHSSATARDRDRLRQAHLQRLGWRFHRIWSTDWFFEREAEIERAVEAYEESVRLADLADTQGSDDISRGPPATPSRGETDGAQAPARRANRPLFQVHESIDEYSERELRALIEWLCSDGLLRTDEELLREATAELKFHRVGSRIRDRIENAIGDVRKRSEARRS